MDTSANYRRSSDDEHAHLRGSKNEVGPELEERGPFCSGDSLRTTCRKTIWSVTGKSSPPSRFGHRIRKDGICPPEKRSGFSNGSASKYQTYSLRHKSRCSRQPPSIALCGIGAMTTRRCSRQRSALWREFDSSHLAGNRHHGWSSLSR
jgi:hypothetical protein